MEFTNLLGVRAGRTEEFPGVLMVCPEALDPNPNFWSQGNNSSSNNKKIIATTIHSLGSYFKPALT